jgi:hypothetical protein
LAKALKALLAAEIVRALDQGGLTVRKAESITHIAAADWQPSDFPFESR